MTTEFCDNCESALPAGCLHMHGHQKECSLGKRTDAPWVVGMAIWKDLTDRRGVKNELSACESQIQAEIIETIGKIAIAEVKSLRGVR